MLVLSSGEDAWGLSESGLLHLPLSKLYDYPILMPETTTVFLAVDDCNRGLAKARAADRQHRQGQADLQRSGHHRGAGRAGLKRRGAFDG